jgi:plastocyanin
MSPAGLVVGVALAASVALIVVVVAAGSAGDTAPADREAGGPSSPSRAVTLAAGRSPGSSASGSGASPGTVASPGTSAGPSAMVPLPSPAPSGSAAPITVVAAEFVFSPMTVVVPAAGTTTIVLRNGGLITHNLTVDALGLSIVAARGGSSQAAFTDLPPGTYPLYCSVSGHREAGMVGTLIVE